MIMKEYKTEYLKFYTLTPRNTIKQKYLKIKKSNKIYFQNVINIIRKVISILNQDNIKK